MLARVASLYESESCFQSLSRMKDLFLSVVVCFSVMISFIPRGIFFFSHLQIAFISAILSSSSSFNISFFISLSLVWIFLSPILLQTFFVCVFSSVNVADFLAPQTIRQYRRWHLIKLSYSVRGESC